MTTVPARATAIALGAIAATAVAQGCGRFALTPLLPAMQQAAGFDHGTAGLLAAANFAGYLAGSLFLAARAGSLRLSPVAFGLAAIVIGSLAMAVTTDLAAWFAGRFVAGVGGAFLFLGAIDAAVRLAPSIGARPFAGVGLGITLTGALALGVMPDWRLGWIAVGMIAVLVWPLTRVLQAHGGGSGLAEPPPPVTAPLLRLGLSYACFAVAFGAAATFFVSLFAGGDSRDATLAWILAGVFAVPSVPLWNQVARRLGRTGALIAALALEAAGIALAALDPRAATAAIAGALLGGTFMGITALGLLRARELAAQAPRRISALMTALFGLGQIAGAPIAGWIAARHGGLAAGLWFATFAAALGAVLLLPDIAATRRTPSTRDAQAR